MTSFERCSNIAVVVVAGVVIGTNLYNRWGLQVPKPPPVLSKQLTGKPLPGSSITGNQGTITLFISKDCHFCTDSMDFYRRLSDLRSTTRCDIKLFAAGPRNRETREDIQAYLAKHDLAVDGIEMLNFSRLGVSGTPTLVLQDASRLVRGVWLGYLPEASENEVLSKTKSFCPG
jgi:hypothetical protein